MHRGLRMERASHPWDTRATYAAPFTTTNASSNNQMDNGQSTIQHLERRRSELLSDLSGNPQHTLSPPFPIWKLVVLDEIWIDIQRNNSARTRMRRSSTTPVPFHSIPFHSNPIHFHATSCHVITRGMEPETEG